MRRVLSVAVAGFVFLTAGLVVGGAELRSPYVLTSNNNNNNPGFFVTNDRLHPVPVLEQGTVNVNVLNGAVHPFEVAQSFLNFGAGRRFRTFGFDVPAGKMLVIETVTVTAVVETGQKVRATLSVQGNGAGDEFFGVSQHVVTLEQVAGFGPGDYFEKTQSMRGYAAGPSGVSIQIERNSDVGAGGAVGCSISGYLADLPAHVVE